MTSVFDRLLDRASCTYPGWRATRPVLDDPARAAYYTARHNLRELRHLALDMFNHGGQLGQYTYGDIVSAVAEMLRSMAGS